MARQKRPRPLPPVVVTDALDPLAAAMAKVRDLEVDLAQARMELEMARTNYLASIQAAVADNGVTQLLTIQDVAERLKTTPDKVRSLIQGGHIPSVTFGDGSRSRRVEAREVERYIEGLRWSPNILPTEHFYAQRWGEPVKSSGGHVPFEKHVRRSEF